MTPQPIKFYFRNQIARVDGLPTTTTVLDWLRIHAGRPGTKEGCAEGDCGACTIVVAELADAADPAQGAIRVGDLALRPINACIRFLPTLHGKALLTVEDLRSLTDRALHPVQQALVDCHASQCGFCTPGFVMSLFATYTKHIEAGTRPTRQQVADDLAGNLCRCTGYRPILDAAAKMFEFPAEHVDAAPIASALRAIAAETEEPFVYAAPNPAYPVADGARIDHFHAPKTLAGLAALYAEKPRARLLAGATDIGLWVNKLFRDVGDLIYLGDVVELRAIERDGSLLRIGAAVPLEDAWGALIETMPELEEMALRFAGPPVRHAGTMGGNVANGSPIGDAAPVLMALDATLVLQQGVRIRRLALTDFYLDYMRNALEPGEFLHSIDVALPAPETHLRAYKISKRTDCDISAVSCGFALTLRDDQVASIRLAFGGMAATVRRAREAEAALLGETWSETAIRAAMDALGRDFAPLTDLRASKDYRLRVARNLLWRFWVENRPIAPLPQEETRAQRIEHREAVA
ncbi:xanthine dehydrogenase small subunit [Acidiphilium sp. AL]|uniref:xanthine dehydrogenase small subunit n=1 Tax=Acidiphilium sp. AL TaxID=2871704 RepID=UPI0021CB9791|nr:xanthine dehydrogenase small subunit [Acidiphilium sp. AL]MCU4160751.1 xanthine dehydrogenase small subunit [Acidiphilium sp. AL]